MIPAFAKAAEGMAVERLLAGESVRFIARGRSMWPFVLDGDLLVIRPIKGALRSGDLVWAEDGPVHRVIAITPGPRYWLRGDALLKPDGAFRRDQLLGRVEEIRRKGRSVPLRARVGTVGVATILGLARLAGQITRR